MSVLLIELNDNRFNYFGYEVKDVIDLCYPYILMLFSHISPLKANCRSAGQ